MGPLPQRRRLLLPQLLRSPPPQLRSRLLALPLKRLLLQLRRVDLMLKKLMPLNQVLSKSELRPQFAVPSPMRTDPVKYESCALVSLDSRRRLSDVKISDASLHKSNATQPTLPWSTLQQSASSRTLSSLCLMPVQTTHQAASESTFSSSENLTRSSKRSTTRLLPRKMTKQLNQNCAN